MATEEMPDSVKQMLPRTKNLISPESWQKGISFKPKSDDVLLTSGLKSGTTWVEQIMQGLRSRGKMDFEEICVAIPCIEYAADSGVPDLYEEHKYKPQLFQTHMDYKDTPTGFGKHIVVVRDPKDSAVSLYYYVVNWFFEESELSLDDFIEWYVVKECAPEFAFTNPTQMRHLIGWFPKHKDENVLWLHYEDLKADLKQCIKLISDFLEVGVDDQELLDLVEKQASQSRRV